MPPALLQLSFLRTPRTVALGLTLAGLCAFSAAAARPVLAQNLTYTLSGVTFSDGAVATGYFIFNPATQSFGTFRITTTDGTTDSLSGGVYALPATSTFKAGIGGAATGNGYFEFDTFSTNRTLGLATSADASSPGTVPLALFSSSFASREFTGASTRTITAGFLDIAAPAAVPEASTTISLGLLLVLGAGGLVMAKRRRTVSAPSA